MEKNRLKSWFLLQFQIEIKAKKGVFTLNLTLFHLSPLQKFKNWAKIAIIAHLNVDGTTEG